MACQAPNCLSISGILSKVVDYEVVAPWVKVFLSDDSGHFITVGNKSSDDSSAVISSFQWGMSNGNGVRIEVVDEQGGNFSRFFDKVLTSASDLKKKCVIQCQWGWVTSGCDGQINPPIVSTAIHTLILGTVEVHYEHTFKFVLNGTDQVSIGQEFINLQQHYGTDKQKVSLKDAITNMCKDCCMQVAFMRFPDGDGDPIPDGWTFKPDNPDVWSANARNPVSVINNWLEQSRVTTNNDKGVYAVYNDVKGQIELWEDSLSRGGQKPTGKNMYLGTFLVNGGGCSPVIQFTPRFNFPIGAVSRTGGMANTKNSSKALRQDDPSNTNNDFKFDSKLCGPHQNDTGLTTNLTIAPQAQNAFGKNAAQKAQNANTAMFQANAPFLSMSRIEADLVIQGNPAFDNPYKVRGFWCGIIVIAPYHLASGSVCPDWQPPSGALAGSNCIKEMSNQNWRVNGVSHEIKPGSFTTTLKVQMASPGGTASTNANLGDSPTAPPIPTG